MDLDLILITSFAALALEHRINHQVTLRLFTSQGGVATAHLTTPAIQAPGDILCAGILDQLP